MIEEQGMFQREREILSRESIVLTKETGARLFGRAYHALTETNSRSKEDRWAPESKGRDTLGPKRETVFSKRSVRCRISNHSTNRVRRRSNNDEENLVVIVGGVEVLDSNIPNDQGR